MLRLQRGRHDHVRRLPGQWPDQVLHQADCHTVSGATPNGVIVIIGHNRLQCFRTNHSNSVLIRDHNSAEVPLDLLQLADGDVIFEEEGNNVSLSTAPGTRNRFFS